MNSIQDWSNANEGFIELGGHLTGAVQRSRQIQVQQEQLEALKGLKSELQRQRLKQELVEASQNVLYDYKAAYTEIFQALKQNSADEFARLLLLENAVQESGIGHEMFSNLEWKDFCTKTLGEIAELKSWALTNLDAATQQTGMLLFARFQADANRLAEERLASLNRAEYLEKAKEALKKGTSLGRTSFWLAFAGLFSCGLTSIPAVICGHKLLRAMKDLENAPRSYAVTGLIIGYLFLALLGIALVHPLFGK